MPELDRNSNIIKIVINSRLRVNSLSTYFILKRVIIVLNGLF